MFSSNFIYRNHLKNSLIWYLSICITLSTPWYCSSINQLQKNLPQKPVTCPLTGSVPLLSCPPVPSLPSLHFAPFHSLAFPARARNRNTHSLTLNLVYSTLASIGLFPSFCHAISKHTTLIAGATVSTRNLSSITEIDALLIFACRSCKIPSSHAKAIIHSQFFVISA